MAINTATITYHASHNYGSMLQAYALQQTLLGLGYGNRIINLRTARQKEMYSRPWDRFPCSLRDFLIEAKHLPFRNALQKKHDLFEEFIKNELQVTREYASAEELMETADEYDCFIAGGDQIWNTFPVDFDWSFYLPFTERKKISYSASMGPAAEKEISEREKVGSLLKRFSSISVREEGTQRMVEKLSGMNAEIHIDPTLLLGTEQWRKMAGKERLIDGDYILVYSPLFKKDVYEIAMKLGKRFGMKVVTSNHVIYHKPSVWGLEYHLEAGPKEFLNMVDNARLVVCGSYHAILFSKIMETPFLAVNGDKDNRMSTFLKRAGLAGRSIDTASLCDEGRIKEDNIFSCHFGKANEYTDIERKKSIDYLIKSIEG